MMARDSRASINMLNSCSLINIFQFLSLPDRVRAERVCKRWRNLSEGTWFMIWTLDLSSFMWGSYTLISEHMIYKILQKCGKYLKRINLSKGQDSTIDSTVESWHLAISTITKLCPNLEDIDITALIICSSDIEKLTDSYRNLTKLSLLTDFHCDEELQNLFERNSKLQYLKIVGNPSLGNCLLCLPAQSMHTVILERCHFQVKLLPKLCTELKKFENLRHFTLERCGPVPKRILDVIAKSCKNLTILEFNCFPRCPCHTVDSILHMANLQVLKVYNNFNITDEFLADLAQHCQQLTSLDISDCWYVTDAGLAAITTLLKLEKLTINGCDKIIGDGLQNTRMCNLKELYCKSCVLIKDQGISTFIESSDKLQWLDLSGCYKITDVTYEAAVKACKSRTNNVKLIIAIDTDMYESEVMHPPLSVDELNSYLNDVYRLIKEKRERSLNSN